MSPATLELLVSVTRVTPLLRVVRSRRRRLRSVRRCASDPEDDGATADHASVPSSARSTATTTGAPLRATDLSPDPDDALPGGRQRPAADFSGSAPILTQSSTGRSVNSRDPSPGDVAHSSPLRDIRRVLGN